MTGVSKFDGTIWTTYTTADGLANDTITAIAIDAQGNKWFGTLGGVTKLSAEPTEIKQTIHENSLEIFPNPANTSCIIRFMLEKESYVNISALNSQGQMVKTIYNGTLSPNSYEFETDISDLSEGSYPILLKTNLFNIIRKLVVIK